MKSSNNIHSSLDLCHWLSRQLHYLVHLRLEISHFFVLINLWYNTESDPVNQITARLYPIVNACTYSTQIQYTVFPRIVPVNIINFRPSDDAGSNRGRVLFESGYY